MAVVAANSAGQIVGVVGSLFAQYDLDGDDHLSIEELRGIVQRFWCHNFANGLCSECWVSGRDCFGDGGAHEVCGG